MRLSVLLKNDCNDTSQQNFFSSALWLTKFPEEKFVPIPSWGYSSESTISKTLISTFKVTNQWRHDPYRWAVSNEIIETSRNVQNSGFDRILTRTFPDAITNWAAEPQVGIISNSDRIVVPVENYE